MKKLLVVPIIVLVIFGCSGADNTTSEKKAPIIPDITDVVFFTCNSPDFNPEHEPVFNVGDEFDIIIYASDRNLDMEILFVTECDISDCKGTYSGPVSYALPAQIGAHRGYHFDRCFIWDVPAGFYRFEFQIDDSAGHSSNIFEVVIEVR